MAEIKRRKKGTKLFRLFDKKVIANAVLIVCVMDDGGYNKAPRKERREKKSGIE